MVAKISVEGKLGVCEMNAGFVDISVKVCVTQLQFDLPVRSVIDPAETEISARGPAPIALRLATLASGHFPQQGGKRARRTKLEVRCGCVAATHRLSKENPPPLLGEVSPQTTEGG